MITYEYLCGHCGCNLAVKQSIKDTPLVECPECNRLAFHRVITGGGGILSRPDCTTLGQQADRNNKKFGRHTLEEKRYRQKEQAEAGRKREGRVAKPKRPWWRKTDKPNLELAKLAPNIEVKDKKVVKREELSPKAIDYIMTGKK